MTRSEIVKAVTHQVINMLENDIIEGYGGESFIGWLEDGEVFRLNGMNEEDIEIAMEIAHEISVYIDNVSFKLEENI